MTDQNQDISVAEPVTKRVKFFHKYPSDWQGSQDVSKEATPSPEEQEAQSVQETSEHETEALQDPEPLSNQHAETVIAVNTTQETISQINRNLNQQYSEFRKQIESVVGPITDERFHEARDRSNGDLNIAINIIFDEPAATKKTSQKQKALDTVSKSQSIIVESNSTQSRLAFSQPSSNSNSNNATPTETAAPETRSMSESQSGSENTWKRKYIGSLQAEIMVTRSGRNLISYQDPLYIIGGMSYTNNPAKAPAFNTNKDPNSINHISAYKTDSFVRVCNKNNVEIGRFFGPMAKIVGVLLDTGTCQFEATCIFANETLKIGDQFYIQLDCYLLKSGFDAYDKKVLGKDSGDSVVQKYHLSLLPRSKQKAYASESDSDDVSSRSSFFNNMKESKEELMLKLKQKSLVGLFQKLGLKQVLHANSNNKSAAFPSALSETQGDNLLDQISKAAEISSTQAQDAKEDDEDENAIETETGFANGSNSDFKEIELDQLDKVYRRCGEESQDFELSEIEPPKSFNLNLRAYQKRGLNWMLRRESEDISMTKSIDSNGNEETLDEPMHPLWQEYEFPLDPNDKSQTEENGRQTFYANLYSGDLSLIFPRQKKAVKGGILADEMGLGKTISIMALVHSNKYNVPPPLSDPNAHIPENSPQSTSDFAKYTTLIVAPMSLLSQWESEAYKASKPGTMRVLVYYGATAHSVNLRKLLCGPDAKSTAPHIVITSYGTIASEHSTLVQFKNKQHLQRLATTRQQQSLFENGDQQANTQGRKLILGTEEMEWEDHLDLGLFGVFGINFYRIVLDEGHMIKNRATRSAKSCYALRGERRWVLTGTPIVNRLEDLFSLIKFLKAEPWDNFSFWKTFITVPFVNKKFDRALGVIQKVVEPILLRRTKDMKEKVLIPNEEDESNANQGDGLKDSADDSTNNTKNGTIIERPLVELPSKEVIISRINLSTEEREIYNLMFAKAKGTYENSVSSGSVMKKYTTILAQILRLRQACCHPALVTRALMATRKLAEGTIINSSKKRSKDSSSTTLNEFVDDGFDNDTVAALVAKFNNADNSKDWNGAEIDIDTSNQEKFGVEMLHKIEHEEAIECPICACESIPLDQRAVPTCWHVFCLPCLLELFEYNNNKTNSDDEVGFAKCPVCTASISKDKIYLIRRNEVDEESDYEDEDDNQERIKSSNNHSSSVRIKLKHYNPFTQSSKIQFLVDKLKETRSYNRKLMKWKKQQGKLYNNDDNQEKINEDELFTKKPIKTVVFSQFTQFLDIIQQELKSEGFRYVRFDGTLSQQERAKVLAQFTGEYYNNNNNNSNIQPYEQRGRNSRKNQRAKKSIDILLISLKSGGVGLNLVCAQQVFMMDPWWSFAVEAQAIDRIHRMGQSEQVKVYRLIVSDSVEEKMLKIQEQKKLLALSSLENTSGYNNSNNNTGDGSNKNKLGGGESEKAREFRMVFE